MTEDCQKTYIMLIISLKTYQSSVRYADTSFQKEAFLKFTLLLADIMPRPTFFRSIYQTAIMIYLDKKIEMTSAEITAEIISNFFIQFILRNHHIQEMRYGNYHNKGNDYAV